MDIKVLVGLHKTYTVSNDPMYYPIMLGAVGKETISLKDSDKKVLRDDSGDNISEKNPSYCELTGLYYGWKSLKCEYLGLCHYRRYFKGKKKEPLKKSEAEEILSEYDMILPKKRRYFIETLESHYAHTLSKEHLPLAREVLSEKYPSYLKYFDRAKKKTSGYMFNMFIMKREHADMYLSWLFTILTELEFRIDTKNLSSFDMRLYGRVSEVLFNAFILKLIEDEGIVPYECSVLYLEKVHYFKKIYAFLMAKFFGRKYKESF